MAKRHLRANRYKRRRQNALYGYRVRVSDVWDVYVPRIEREQIGTFYAHLTSKGPFLTRPHTNFFPQKIG